MSRADPAIAYDTLAASFVVALLQDIMKMRVRITELELKNSDLRNARSNDVPNGTVEATETIVRKIYHRAPRAFDWLTHASDEVSPGRRDSWKELYMREHVARGRLEDKLRQAESGNRQDWKEVTEQVEILQRMIAEIQSRAENPQPACTPKSVTQEP